MILRKIRKKYVYFFIFARSISSKLQESGKSENQNTGCHSLCTYRHDLLQVVQGEGCHANRGIKVTWHDGRSQQLLVDAGRESDVQGDAVVYGQAHELSAMWLRVIS